DSFGDLFGTGENGAIFELPAGGQTTVTLANVITGFSPAGSLAIDKNGNLFGTTTRGGIADAGTVFEMPALRAELAAATPAPTGPNNQPILVTPVAGVSYTVTFTQPVTGVDASAFALATTGSVAASSIQVQPIAGTNGTGYSVTISGITGTGSLGLNL